MVPRYRAKVLIADAPELEDVLRSCFAMQHVTYVSTWAEAVLALRKQQFDLAMIGLLFDESRTFDLIQRIRADRRHDAMRIVCVRGPHSRLSDEIDEGVREAVQALGGDGFFRFALDQGSLASLCGDVEKVLERG